MHRLLAVVLLVFPAAASALDPFIVRDIRVEGIQRVEAGTIFNYLPVKVGDAMNDEKASAAIRALFATGFFKDVRLEADRDVLIVVVEERPAIASIDFTGMKEFEKDAIIKAFKEVGLAESRIFDRSLLDQAEQELKRQYLNKGKYGVSITTTITPLERNRVGINFNIDEGEIAKISAINIIGNQSFGEKDLLDLFTLTTSGWFTWYTKNDQYSKQKLSADLETVRSYYLNRGYIDFNIDSAQVSITPDRKDIYITISVTEGEKYTFSDVKLGGQMLVPEEELKKLITIKAGDVYSREKLNEASKKISDRLGNDGYAFANVNPVPEIDRDKREVAFTILVDPGRRVYVRRINVVGNTRTRDEVVRREMRQLEGSYYDADKLQKSKQRVDRLGYFSEIDVETPPVPGTTDQVDVTMKVKEKPTGAFLIGAGFSSVEKLVLSTSVSQDNIFGSGKSLAFAVNSGKINKVYSLSFTDPYYTVDGVSRGFDLYDRHTNAAALGLGDYTTTTIGSGVRWSYPVTDYDRISYGLGVEGNRVDAQPDAPQRYLDYVNTFGSSTNSVLGTAGWGRDTRDSALLPTRGLTRRAGIEASLPAGKLRYYKLSLQETRYFPLSTKYTLMINAQAGMGDGYDGKPLPFYKNYYAGGINSVRGYQTAALGPRDPATGDILGGNRELNVNTELLFPMPGSGQDRSMRLGIFLDGGQVYGKEEKVALNDLRYSMGMTLSWISPFGPLRMSYGIPLNKKPDDRIQRFQFTIGNIF